MIVTVQRWYAFAVLLLRELIRAVSLGRYFEWKALVVMTGSQVFLVFAALYTFSAARAERLEVLESKRSLRTFSFGCATLLHLANEYAERRLLPRFQEAFGRLDRKEKGKGMIAVLLLVVLCDLAMTAAAYAVRRVLGIHESLP